MKSLLRAALKNKRASALWILAAALVLLPAFVATAQATDEASFCVTCHEMTPFYTAWNDGLHSDVACVECHVDAGTVERLTHKVEALGEVYGHFFGEPLFPMNATEMPNERCLGCHEGTIDPGVPGFDHETHRAGRDCVVCHSSVGHEVSAADLAEAGILNVEAQAEKDARVVAAAGKGVANLENHRTVSCEGCHDMAATGCESCHEPGHEPRDVSTVCTDCHATDTAWAFAHPDRADCATCHTTPAEHFEPACETCHTPGDFSFEHPADTAACETCHTRPAEHRDGVCTSCHDTGTSWAFAHPSATASCATCHTAPANHYTGTCSACHTPGTGFERAVFRHPGASATCTSCHTRPASHESGTCTTCHKPAASWAFYHPTSTSCASCHTAPSRHYAASCASCHTPSKPFESAVFTHPGASATCTSCHSKPAGHSTASCTTCHKPASSWAFYHPTSTSCASCHTAPSNHYGTSCASCHSPSTSWGSATFSHPQIPGGEHTYRSFSCVTCHPGGYTSYSCLACHSDNSGGDDDDDDD